MVTAIAVAVIVTVAGLGLTYFLTEQTGCEIGKAVVTNEHLETPIFALNAPYMGNAATNGYTRSSPLFQFESGSLNLRSQPLQTNLSIMGSFTGLLSGKFWPTGPYYMTGHWTIYSVRNATMHAFEPLHPCTAPFIAELTALLPPVGNANLLLPNNTTDVGESTQPVETPNLIANGLYFSKVYTAYNTSNYPEIDTCSSPGQSLTFNGLAQVPIGIPFTYEGQNRTVMGQLLWQGYSGEPFLAPTLTYDFPGYFGIWQIYSFAGNDTLGFLSFNYEPC